MSSHYGVELGRIEDELGSIGLTAKSGPIGCEESTRLVALAYRKATLRGTEEAFRAADAAADRALAAAGAWPDLCLLKAQLDSRFHRFSDVPRHLGLASALPGTTSARALLADVAVERGQYDEARREYEHLVEEDRNWEHLVRLAHLWAEMGDVARADRLYADAEDEITAKEMRAYAIVQLQRGLLDQRCGDLDAALRHCDVAERAYSGWWRSTERRAALLALMGELHTAVALYWRVLAASPKPEIDKALGVLYLQLGRADEARSHYAHARDACLDSVGKGEVHHYHLLAELYADAFSDPEAAVRWAREDVALRPNAMTRTTLAWALFRAGQIVEASDVITKALSLGVENDEMLEKAAAIRQAAVPPRPYAPVKPTTE